MLIPLQEVEYIFFQLYIYILIYTFIHVVALYSVEYIPRFGAEVWRFAFTRERSREQNEENCFYATIRRT